jgi:hypothetical protein
MTDLEKTLAFLEDMGYNKLGEKPEGKAGFRYYFHDRLFISVDQSSFTFNKDESLAGIGYGPPSYWKDDYRQTQREAKNFYEEDYDAFFDDDHDDDDDHWEDE